MKLFNLLRNIFKKEEKDLKFKNDFEVIDAGFGDCDCSSDCSSDCDCSCGGSSDCTTDCSCDCSGDCTNDEEISTSMLYCGCFGNNPICEEIITV